MVQRDPDHARSRRLYRLARPRPRPGPVIVEGIALIQDRGGEILEAHPGDVIWTPAGEEHWHAAAPDQFMTHLALWETDEVQWLEHVTDAEYGGPRTSSCR